MCTKVLSSKTNLDKHMKNCHEEIIIQFQGMFRTFTEMGVSATRCGSCSPYFLANYGSPFFETLKLQPLRGRK